MSLAEDVVSMLYCPGCRGTEWDLRATGEDDLPRLEGTLCCCRCGQAFAARGGVLDMVPDLVEDTVAALRRRIASPPVATFYEEHLRHFLTPLTSSLEPEEREDWLTRQTVPMDRKIADLGCGRGTGLDLMSRTARPRIAIGVDASPVLLAEAARNARKAETKNQVFIRARVEELPLVPSQLAWANCYGVLHRLPEPGKTIPAIASLLQRDGLFTCLTALRLGGPLSWGQRALARCARMHVFTPDQLRTYFDESDLSIQDMRDFESVTLVQARVRDKRND